MTNSNFPMGISFVLECDAPNAERLSNARKTEIQTECPWCGKIKLYVNTQKNTFYCQHCQEKGGMLALHMKYTGILSTKAALADLYQKYNKVPESERVKFLEDTKPVSIESKAAPIDRRDKCYRRLISACSLGKKDRDDLLKRGLSNEAISSLGIVSVPVLRHTVAEKVISDGSDLDYRLASMNKFGSDIPGIYPDENDDAMFVKLKQGILIPVVNKEGKISMFQIRYHNPKPIPKDISDKEKEKLDKQQKKYHKYAQLSSGFIEKGCSTAGLDKVHHVGFDFENNQTPEEVCITEGCLKADVASYLENGKAYLAILGVNNTNQLYDEVKWLYDNGTSKIRVRYDMDFMTNDAVQMAIYTTNKICNENGYKSVIYKPYNADDEWKELYEKWKKVMNGQIGQKKLNPLKYTVVLRRNDLNADTPICINDLWKPSIGKGIDDFLHNR